MLIFAAWMLFVLGIGHCIFGPLVAMAGAYGWLAA